MILTVHLNFEGGRISSLSQTLLFQVFEGQMGRDPKMALKTHFRVTLYCCHGVGFGQEERGDRDTLSTQSKLVKIDNYLLLHVL